MSARSDLLARFGPVQDWLLAELEHMSSAGFQKFYADVETHGRLPSCLENTMPKTSDGFIVDPAYAPPAQRAQLEEAWRNWIEIWTTPPWLRHPPIRTRPTRFKD